MKNDFVTNLTETGKLSYQTLQELNDLYAQFFNKFTELQLTLARLGLESSYEQVKLLSDASSYEGLLSAESSFANDYSNKLMALTRKSGEFMLESHDEFSAWLEKQFEEGKQQVGKQFEEGKQQVGKPTKPKSAAKRTTVKKEAA